MKHLIALAVSGLIATQVAHANIDPEKTCEPVWAAHLATLKANAVASVKNQVLYDLKWNYDMAKISVRPEDFRFDIEGNDIGGDFLVSFGSIKVNNAQRHDVFHLQQQKAVYRFITEFKKISNQIGEIVAIECSVGINQAGNTRVRLENAIINSKTDIVVGPIATELVSPDAHRVSVSDGNLVSP